VVQKNNPADSKELAAEKKLARGTRTDPDFERGDAFVDEHTGSATMINVDGRWDFDHKVGSGKKH